jgi:quinol monooxygenase YgiN
VSDRPVTLINVFTVESENQQRLINLLTEITERSVRHAAGFLSARLHRSLDGTKVTMIAEWRSIADYEAMRADPTPRPYLSGRSRWPSSSPACTKSWRLLLHPSPTQPASRPDEQLSHRWLAH